MGLAHAGSCTHARARASQADFEVVKEQVDEAQLAISAGTSTGQLVMMHHAKRSLLRYITRCKDLNECLEQVGGSWIPQR
jgi:hypothetical protein